MRTLLAFLFFFFAADLPAQDDRDRTTPVASVWFPSVDVPTLGVLASIGWRFVDLAIESNSPLRFTVTAVQNTDSYAKSWWYWVGVDQAQLQNNLAANSARLVDLDSYTQSGNGLFVAIAISNTGSDQKAWWWFTGLQTSQVSATANQLSARPIVVTPHYVPGTTTRHWAAVMIANAGADYRAWTWSAGVPQSGFSGFPATHRFYSIEYDGNYVNVFGIVTSLPAFRVITVDNPEGLRWGYHLGTSLPQVNDALAQRIHRPVALQQSLMGGVSPLYIGVSIDNANALEGRARQTFLQLGGGPLGSYGFLLREVGGSVLGRMRDSAPFEASGTIATLEHGYAMRRVSQGFAPFGPFLSSPIAKPTSCVGGGPSQTIELTLRQMMENDDHLAELAIQNAFTPALITGAMPTFGMLSTMLGLPASCGGMNSNVTTLTDLAALHEQVANGALNNVTDQRAKFYELMDESPTSFGAWGSTSLNAKIDAEAVAIGMPPAVRDNFKSQLHVAFRSGVAGHPAPNAEYHCSTFGWMRVPFRSFLGVIAPREFVFGAFNDGYHQLEPVGRAAMADAALVLVWDRVQAAMQSWGDYTPGSITSLPGSGCPGSAGTPLHTTTGLPDLYTTVSYSLTNTPANALAVAMFGFSSTQWGGASLPADLAPIGAPGCVLRTDPSVLFAVVTTASGTATKAIAIGTSPSLVGTVWYSQFLVFDPPANGFGATVSNAKKTTVGGFF